MSNISRDLERWLPVVGFEGSYEVSDLGQVRSLDRMVRCGGGRYRISRGALKRPTQNPLGYQIIALYKDNISRGVGVHILVLEAFVGPRPHPKWHSLHGDGNPRNNCLGNLRWGSVTENRLDTVRHGNDAMTNRVACPLRHLLVAPNLRAYHIRGGHRGCLACSRARANRQRANAVGRPFNFEARADEHYAKIMAAA